MKTAGNSGAGSGVIWRRFLWMKEGLLKNKGEEIMDQNNTYEQEIDLKDLMFAVLHKWKGILLVAIVFAILLGGVKAVMTYRNQNNEENILEAEENYEEELHAYETSKETLERELGNLQTDIENQQNYMEKSVLMNMSPYDIYEARADIFIKTDYEIMPGMVYQNVDYTDTILQTYQSVMTSVAFLSHIAESTGIDVQYLQELIKIERGSTVIGSTSKLTNLLTVKVKNSSKKDAEAVLKKLLDGIELLQANITANIGEHTVNTVNKSTGATVDLALADQQREKNNQLINLQQSLEEKQQALDDLEEPEKLTSASTATIKDGIKYGVLGGVLGGFMMVFFICVIFVMSDKMYSSKELRRRSGIKVLGIFPVSEKKSGMVNNLLNRLEGKIYSASAEEEAALIAANICNYANEVKKLLVTGTIDEKKIAEVTHLLADKLPGMELVSGSNMLKNVETIKALPTCDGVVLVEQAGVSTYGMMGQEIEKVRDLQKEMIGCVVFE